MLNTGLEANQDHQKGTRIRRSVDDLTPGAAALSPLETAILKTVAYVDIFDYPLTSAEIHRYLIGVKTTASEIDRVLESRSMAGSHIECVDGFYTLPERGEIVETRQKRLEIAKVMWPNALYYGRVIAGLPYITMVTVTGSLAVNNSDLNSDVDYLIVTANDHLWTARAMVVLVVRLAAKRGVALCPNYLVSERALAFHERNLYTAREIAQMVPVAGSTMYNRMREVNSWVEEFLPNAEGVPQTHRDFQVRNEQRYEWMRIWAELLMRTPPGSWLERWEMERKIRKFARLQMGDETAFSHDWCKGHFENHGRRAMEHFDDQWHEIDTKHRVDKAEED